MLSAEITAWSSVCAKATGSSIPAVSTADTHSSIPDFCTANTRSSIPDVSTRHGRERGRAYSSHGESLPRRSWYHNTRCQYWKSHSKLLGAYHHTQYISTGHRGGKT
eukprot:2115204-Rhodomonas_salina.2